VLVYGSSTAGCFSGAWAGSQRSQETGGCWWRSGGSVAISGWCFRQCRSGQRDVGSKQIADVTVTDILAITDKIKNRGADQMALQTRNVLKRLFAYAIAREKTQFNPAAAIEAKFIASARSRDVALSPEEMGKLLRAIYQSSIKRAHKLALHLLILCMVRKGELIGAFYQPKAVIKRNL
jgi:site-specific recombinase XerC